MLPNQIFLNKAPSNSLYSDNVALNTVCKSQYHQVSVVLETSYSHFDREHEISVMSKMHNKPLLI